MTQPPDPSLIFRALADPTRRAVFEQVLRVPEVAVVDLTRSSGVSQGAVSQHLKTLREAGLVLERPEGRRVYYRAQRDGMAPLFDWMAQYQIFWRDGFAQLADLLKEIDP